MANDLTQTTQRSLDEQVIGNLDRLKDQGLEMPPNYSPQNALKSAFFELTNNTAGNLLQAAANNQETKTSISNATSSSMETKYSLCVHILAPWQF